MSWLSRKSILVVCLAGIFLLGATLIVGGVISSWIRPSALASAAKASGQEHSPSAEKADQDAISVNTIRPRHDPSFTMSVSQPAFVTAYYKADLMSRVAGPVKSIVHDIGDRVKAGDVLVVIDMPDLREDVLQKEALVTEQMKKLEVARAEEKVAAKELAVAAGTVAVKTADVERTKASKRFRDKELRRFTNLAGGPSPAVTQDIIDERTEYYEAAVAAVATAEAMVKEAEAKLEAAQAKLEAARADTSMEEAMIRVARKNQDKAQVLLDFATIAAPFAGVITRRNVDPGSFVQSAATAHTEPLLTLARTDIVTVYMKVPDNFAPFVTRDTEAIIEMGSLPGLMIRGKVTRKSDTLETPEHDRTMRVEVDLFNGSAAEYQVFLATERASGNADLKSHRLPVFPTVQGKELQSEGLGLIPGQFGKMRLVLRSFQNAYLLPSSAVFSQGGASYIFLVKDGRAIRIPVQIQGDNGKTVKLALIENKGGEEVRRELAGSEDVISSNLGELINGQAVKSTPVDW